MIITIEYKVRTIKIPHRDIPEALKRTLGRITDPPEIERILVEPEEGEDGSSHFFTPISEGRMIVRTEDGQVFLEG